MTEERQIEIDEDIDIERLFSPTLKLLCKKFDSIFIGNHDNVDDIYFFDKYKRYFFTFSDSISSIYAETTHISEDEIEKSNNELAFMAPTLRAVYILKPYRRRGLQKELFTTLNKCAEQTKEPYIAISDPFKITKSRFENCIKKAWYKFLTDGHERTHTWKEDVKKQCERFKSYGLSRFVLPEYCHTKPFQHFIRVPNSCSSGIKLAIKSIQRANNIVEDFDIVY